MRLLLRNARALLLLMMAALALTLAGCSSSAVDSSEPESTVNVFSSQQTEEEAMEDPELYARGTADYAQRYAERFETHRVDGKDVFVHVPEGISQGGRKVPLVLFMCGTTGNPRGDAAWSGWVEESEAEGFVLVTPDYDNYVTYGETGFLSDVIDWAVDELPVDAARVYSVGFSNGGAISVAMANDHPEKIAAISAAGWMVPLRHVRGVEMPFQVIQGTGEYTETTRGGAMQVMRDEREAIRGLMLRDGLISRLEKADYDAVPYWGYTPDATSSEQADGFTWEYSDYFRDGSDDPYAQLALVSDDIHRPRSHEAHVAWEFLRHFTR